MAARHGLALVSVLATLLGVARAARPLRLDAHAVLT